MEENYVFQCDENIETIMDVDSYEDHDALLYNSNDNMSGNSSQYVFQCDNNIETIMDVDSYEDHDALLFNSNNNMNKNSSQYDFTEYSIVNDSLMVIEDDENNYSSDSSNEDLEVKKKLNESTSIQIIEQKETEDNVDEFEISDQQMPTTKIGSTVISPSKNIHLLTKQNKTNSLDLEKKILKINSSNLKVNHSIITSQVNNRPSFSVVSTSSLMKPTPTIKFQPESSITEIESNKNLSTPNTSDESKVYLVSNSGINAILNRKELQKSLNSNSSIYSYVNKLNNVTKSVEQTKNINLTSNTNKSGNISKFVETYNMQKVPGGKYKMIPNQKTVHIDLENLFKRNSHFTKQKMESNNMKNEHKNKNFIQIESSSKNSYQFINSDKIRYLQKNPKVSSRPVWNKMSKSIDFDNFNRDKNHIPHTITSKETTEKNHKNIIIENCEVKVKSNGRKEMLCPSSGLIKMPPKSESLMQTDGQSSDVNKYGKKNDYIVQILSLDSLKKPIKHNSNIVGKHLSNRSITTPTTDNALKDFSSITQSSKGILTNNAVKKYSKRKQKLPKGINEQIKLSDGDNKSVKFVSCLYKFCHILVHETKLIDNLYCSAKCKKLNTSCAKSIDKNKMEHFEKKSRFIDLSQQKEIRNVPITPVIERKQLLAKLGNRINKKKELLKSSRPGIMVRNEWPGRVTHPELDEETGELLFDLKTMINDKFILNYMKDMQLKSAPKNLFDNPFPTEKNFFEIGHKLECIDPEHESLFCVMTVANVCGYRIKLHFDEFPDGYDFWVNADCPDMFYAGWCKQNSRIVQPPKNYGKEFEWTNYLKEKNALPAPKCGFASIKNLTKSKSQHKFRIGNKLEALNKLTCTLPKQLICVATVADVLGNRIRIHFDGWTDDFDYWTYITSTNIHPIEWCDNNGHSLSPPSGYNGEKPFSWTEYLKETNSEPVIEDAFIRRPLRNFSINMTIEVVDLVIPTLIRIAKVVDVRGNKLKILYDGFNAIYAYWVEDDSPDIHPVGWSLKTNHPIGLPPADNALWSCRIEGCCGKGNILDELETTRVSIKECPYELNAWKKAVAGLAKLPDRLKTDGITTILTLSSKCQSTEHNGNKEKYKLNTVSQNNLLKQKGKLIHNKSNEQLFIKKKQMSVKQEYSSINSEDSDIKQLDMKNIEPELNTYINNIIGTKYNASNKNNLHIHNTVDLTLKPNDYNRLSLAKQGRAWARHIAQIGIPVFSTNDPRKWSVEKVASYVDQVVLTKYANHTNEEIRISDRFKDQKIDGEAFLMLTQDEIMKLLKIPLGPAIKLTNAIIMLRQRCISHQVPEFDFD